MRIFKAFVTGISTMSIASEALAHAGHGTGAITGLVHWLVEPVHAIPVLAALAVTVISVRVVMGKIR